METTVESTLKLQVIATDHIRNSIYRAFKDAYTLWIDADKFLKIIEGGEIDEEWGGEYTISLLQFKHSTDLIIWGNTGVDAERDFDPFWILFHESQKPEANAVLDDLKEFFEQNHGMLGFKKRLKEFLINLETR